MCSCASRRVVVRPASGHRHRPPRPARRHAAMGVAARHVDVPPPAAERRPRRPLLLGRRLSLGGSGAPDVRTNQSCKACKHETRNAICNLVVRIPNRYRFGSCLIVVPPLSSKRVVVSRPRGVAPMAASVTCTNMHITSSCAKPHASLPRHMSHVQLSIAHFHAPLASALISPAPPYL